MDKLKWKKKGNEIISQNGEYKIIDNPFVYSIEYNGEFISYANSLKEADDIVQKHFNKNNSQ